MYERVGPVWLNNEQVSDSAIAAYRKSLLSSCPNHIVIDNLFDKGKLDEVIKVLQQDQHWKTQQHTYAALNVDSKQWQKASHQQRFVQRDVWQREALAADALSTTVAHDFLWFLRSEEFMLLLSRIFKAALTDINVAKPEVNTNYFRLGPTDFVEQHADDSPSREVCMLLYLNKLWATSSGGELVFSAEGEPLSIEPLYNRCVLFDPSSEGSEHWVKALKGGNTQEYRYNVTSWYWSE